MQAFPHRYRVNAAIAGEYVNVSANGLPSIETASPAEFDGPGDRWSPETLFTATIANCFILTFKAVARASKFEWADIACEVEAVLDRVDKVNLFTESTLNVTLTIADPSQKTQAERILRKSEQNCLITNSLTTRVTMMPHVVVQQLAANN